MAIAISVTTLAWLLFASALLVAAVEQLTKRAGRGPASCTGRASK